MPHDGGATDPDRVREAAGDAAAVIFQQPNFFGVPRARARPRRRGERRRGAADRARRPRVSLGVLEAPGNYGCALAIGEGQSAGNAMSYGGPHYGFLAARNDYIRRLPGRIVGETVDAAGERGYVLTLQTREQHIRREKATSNITTNQTLLALAGLVHLIAARPAGAARDGGDLHGARRATRRSGSQERGSSLCFRNGQRSRSLPCAPDGTRARRSAAARAQASTPATRSAATTPGSTTRCSSP